MVRLVAARHRHTRPAACGAAQCTCLRSISSICIGGPVEWSARCFVQLLCQLGLPFAASFQCCSVTPQAANDSLRLVSLLAACF